MKGAFRQSMGWLHTWTGLVVGWVLFFVFLTGTAGYFDTEIDRWMQPERPLAAVPAPPAEAAAKALVRLEEAAEGAERWFIGLPGTRESPDLRVFWRAPPQADGRAGASVSETLDPATGGPTAYRKTGGGQLLYAMHYRLHYMSATTAYWIVGVCTMFMLVAMVTGIVVHKKIFRHFFTFRRDRGQRSWLDAHNALAVLALPFHLMITYSGLIFFAYLYMFPVISATYGPGLENRRLFFDELLLRDDSPGPAGIAAPLAPLGPVLAEAERRWGAGQVRYIDIRHPGDASATLAVGRIADSPLRGGNRLDFDGVTGEILSEKTGPSSAPAAARDLLLGLHEGLFAGPALRWLYFLSGLMGTAMIGAGLVLWTAKRRARLGTTLGFALVERLNIATVAGLPVAIAVYFWANRLIPAGFEGRAAWEANAMFIAWALLLVHPVLRPPSRAWIEQLGLAAAAFGLLPVLNALTTGRHLGVSLPAGDWIFAGFDLTMLAFALFFAAAARIAHRRASAGTAPDPAPGRATADAG